VSLQEAWRWQKPVISAKEHTLGSRYPNCLYTETPFGDSLSKQIIFKLVWIPRPTGHSCSGTSVSKFWKLLSKLWYQDPSVLLDFFFHVSISVSFLERGVRRSLGAGQGKPDARTRRGVLHCHRGLRPHRLSPAGEIPRSYQEHCLKKNRKRSNHERPIRGKVYYFVKRLRSTLTKLYNTSFRYMYCTYVVLVLGLYCTSFYPN